MRNATLRIGTNGNGFFVRKLSFDVKITLEMLGLSMIGMRLTNGGYVYAGDVWELTENDATDTRYVYRGAAGDIRYVGITGEGGSVTWDSPFFLRALLLYRGRKLNPEKELEMVKPTGYQETEVEKDLRNQLADQRGDAVIGGALGGLLCGLVLYLLSWWAGIDIGPEKPHPLSRTNAVALNNDFAMVPQYDDSWLRCPVEWVDGKPYVRAYKHSEDLTKLLPDGELKGSIRFRNGWEPLTDRMRYYHGGAQDAATVDDQTISSRLALWEVQKLDKE